MSIRVAFYHLRQFDTALTNMRENVRGDVVLSPGLGTGTVTVNQALTAISTGINANNTGRGRTRPEWCNYDSSFGAVQLYSAGGGVGKTYRQIISDLRDKWKTYTLRGSNTTGLATSVLN